ncbi:MAG TPA: hypothetical protein VIO60_08320 [Rectinemataceae bacterium]
MRDLKLFSLTLAREIMPESEPFLQFGEPPKGGAGLKIPSIPPGRYLFSQWAESDFPDPVDGLVAMRGRAEQEGRKTRGPWILRCVAEDGKRVWQGLRELEP